MKTKINLERVLIIIVGLILAIILRYTLLNFKSLDYIKAFKGWYHIIQTHGFSAFSQNFSSYNLPYLYLLYLVARFLPNLPSLVATKLPSMVADFISAGLAYRIVSLKYSKSSLVSLLAFFAILFAPTVVINSAYWGQADALYTTALLACIYFLLIKKSGFALLFFGISLSFKLQAVFLSPLLFALFLRKEISWKYFLLIPVVMFLAIVPAWIAGNQLTDLLLIYPSQAESFEQLVMHAPSVFSWIPDGGQFYPYFYPAGLILGATIGFFFSVFVYKSRAKVTHPILLELALFSVIMMPFFLPKMHDRYFYPADVISILFAFYFPNYFYVPVMMSLISFFSYEPVLFGVEPVPFSLLAFGVLFLLLILGRHLATQLIIPEPATENMQTQ